MKIYCQNRKGILCTLFRLYQQRVSLVQKRDSNFGKKEQSEVENEGIFRIYRKFWYNKVVILFCNIYFLVRFRSLELERSLGPNFCDSIFEQKEQAKVKNEGIFRICRENWYNKVIILFCNIRFLAYFCSILAKNHLREKLYNTAETVWAGQKSIIIGSKIESNGPKIFINKLLNRANVPLMGKWHLLCQDNHYFQC